MSVGDDAAAAAVLAVVSLAAAWGAYLSVRSAAHGPVWALSHLRPALVGGGVVAAIGVALALLVAPIWMGAGIAYVGFVVVWLGWTLNRSLRRATRLGVDGRLTADRRQAVLERISRGLVAAGAVVAVAATWDVTIRGAIALVDYVLVGALVVPGLSARKRARAPRAAAPPAA